MTGTCLLDGNVLVALLAVGHEHRERAVEWFAGNAAPFATCPITEGTLIRFLVRQGLHVQEAASVLEGLRASDRHEFWSDDLRYSADLLAGIRGHRQVTDAYLAGLARHRNGRLVTFDGGLAAVHGTGVVDLIA